MSATIKARIHEVEQRLQELLTEGEAAGGWTDEQTAESDRLTNELKQLDKQVTAFNGTKERLGKIIGYSSDERLRGSGRKTGRGAGAPFEEPKTQSLVSGKPYSCSTLFQTVDPSDGGFGSMFEFCRAAQFGGVDRSMAVSGQSYGIPSDGGHAVFEAFAFEMLDKSVESEVVRPRAVGVPMETPVKHISTFADDDHSGGELYGGLKGQWTEEGGEIAIESAKLRRMTLTAHKLAMRTAATNELLTDAPTFEREFSQRMSTAIGWNLDRAFLITGTGAGQPRSILNDPALITVSKETGQSAATILYDNLVNMRSRLHPTCLRNAVWVANHDTLPQLMKAGIILGEGLEYARVLQQDARGQFAMFGIPVVFTEKANSVGTKGDLMLVDFTQYRYGLLRGSMTLFMDQFTLSSTDQTTWRLTLRGDGQGSWKAPFTPKSGPTLSWCVALENR